ncbi:hypothetical protein GCM10028810_28640 [Spirosoma litoris]
MIHLNPLKRREDIEFWYDYSVLPGDNWNDIISDKIRESNIFILLISADFLASDFIYQQLELILTNKNREYVKIIPILIRDCYWRDVLPKSYQILPTNGTPIYSSRQKLSPDEIFYQISQIINYTIEGNSSTFNINKNDGIVKDIDFFDFGIDNVIIESNGSLNIGHLPVYDIDEVFPLNGVPKITFIEPGNFKKIVASIRHKGRGLVIEGPSGIGKTTAIKKAIERLNLTEADFLYLSARNPTDIDKIMNLPEWHNNIVILDDFHRLDEYSKSYISNYLKYLADVETSIKKLIVIGIPNTGRKLISFGHDLTTRIDIFEISKVNNEKINELIEKGEKALNIKFEKKSDLIVLSNGSLSIAQFICYHSVIDDNINNTVPVTKIVKGNIGDIIAEVRRVMSRKFDNFIFYFSQLGGPRDRTCVKLLKEIAISENGSINLERIAHIKPELESSINKLIANKHIENLLEKEVDCNNYLFYDRVTKDLVIDDPQLLFYLNNTPDEMIAKMAGKKIPKNRERVFISYSHKDSTVLERILVHLKPLFRDGLIDIWSDKRIKPGDKWNDEIETSLEQTKVAILLVSADFIASDYIVNNELPQLLKASSDLGASILPVFIKPANLNKFDYITQYQGFNSPSDTISGMIENDQEKLFVELSQRVEELYQNIIPQ